MPEDGTVMTDELIIDFELAADTQVFITKNPDVTYKNETLKETIENADPSTLFKLTKTISSPTKFVAVEIVNDDFITKNFFSED